MAADFSIKAHDRLPAFQVQLFIGVTPLDLTNASSIKFIMKAAIGGAIKVNAAAVIVTPLTGVVRYDWAAADTDTIGDYTAEWEITWPGPKKQSVPTLTYHTISVLADLDAA